MEIILPEGFEDLKAEDMNSVLEELIRLLVQAGKISPASEGSVAEALKRREQFGSTVISDNVAVPHVQANCIEGLILAFGRSKKGVRYDPGGSRRVHLFFVVLSPPALLEQQLACLGAIPHAVRDQARVLALICEQDAQKLKRLLADFIAPPARGASQPLN